jgi:ADP-ribose pyrophosphatase
MEFFEKTLSKEEIYDGKVFRIHRDNVELSDGRNATREVVEHSGGVCIAAVDDCRNMYFVRQFRYPLQRETLEVPAGKLEPGEAPLPAAMRELSEETGLLADKIDSIGTFYSSPGFCSETLYFYLATGLTEGEQHPDDGELLRAMKMPLEKAVEMVLRDEIKDGKTKTLVLLADRLVPKR